MERVSDRAIEIINALHTERLDYESEYLPLIDCAIKCAAYEDTGLEPEEIKSLIAERAANLKTLNAYRSHFSAVIAPVRHGYWMDSSNGWTCSECFSDNMRDTKWCPSCGAKMDRKVPD